MNKTETCVHYWIIDSPDGPVSQGICIYCGKLREFKNSLEAEAIMWDSIKTTGFTDLGSRVVELEGGGLR